jgi:hypothetical protein
MRRYLPLSAAMLLSACAAGMGGGPLPGPTRAPDPQRCEALFREFDYVKQTMSTPSGFADDASIPPELQLEVGRLRQANCLTRPDDLTLDGSAGPIAESGARIVPATVHAGVVTDMAAEATVIAYFEARNGSPYSVGQPGLGRRIYLGPFVTAGGRDAALQAARRAGFASPYVGRPVN